MTLIDLLVAKPSESHINRSIPPQLNPGDGINRDTSTAADCILSVHGGAGVEAEVLGLGADNLDIFSSSAVYDLLRLKGYGEIS